MKVVAAVFTAPVPVALAAMLPQAEQIPGSDIYGAGGVLIGLGWVIMWWLREARKLPGQAPPEPSFNDGDRRRLLEVHGMLTHRDGDGVERFILAVLTIKELAELAQEERDTRAAIFKSLDEHNRLVGLTTEQLRIMNRRMDALENSA